MCVKQEQSRWRDKIQRCTNVNRKDYCNYGGRGISMSIEFHDFDVWNSYIKSLPDYGKPGYTIDRIENDGNYERGNLRWASKSTQACNRRMSPKNTSGYIGVYWSKQDKKWRSNLNTLGKVIYFGMFDTPEDAARARNEYIIKHKLGNKQNRGV